MATLTLSLSPTVCKLVYNSTTVNTVFLPPYVIPVDAATGATVKLPPPPLSDPTTTSNLPFNYLTLSFTAVLRPISPNLLYLDKGFMESLKVAEVKVVKVDDSDCSQGSWNILCKKGGFAAIRTSVSSSEPVSSGDKAQKKGEEGEGSGVYEEYKRKGSNVRTYQIDNGEGWVEGGGYGDGYGWEGKVSNYGKRVIGGYGLNDLVVKALGEGMRREGRNWVSFDEIVVVTGKVDDAGVVGCGLEGGRRCVVVVMQEDGGCMDGGMYERLVVKGVVEVRIGER